MEEQAILLAIADLGAIFAGLIAIFMVYTQSNGKFSDIDGVRARVIIYSSFAVVLAALLPVVLSGLNILPIWVWRIAATIYFGLGLMITFDVIRRQRALDKSGQTYKNMAFFRATSRVLNILLFALGVAVLIGFNQGGLYVLMLVLNLLMAGLTFIAFALHRLLD